MQQVGLDPEAGLAAARTAHDEYIFVAGVFWVCGAAVHHQPFCFGQEDVILKFWCLKWLDILCTAPTGTTILTAVAVFLGVFGFQIDRKP